MRVRGIGLIALHLFASAALLAQGQGDPPQFRAGVELIQLDVTVLNGKREPVRGLTQADFVVLDNGVETTIRAFTPVELVARAPVTETVWSGEVAPDVATNQAGTQEGRLVTILLDRSIGVGEPAVVARKAAMAVVGQLGPHDLAAVVSTSNGAIQNLTADKSRLARAINASELSTDVSLDTRLIEEERLRSVNLPIPSPLSDGRCLCGLCVLETITRVADAMQGASHRRKVLFFIGSNLYLQSANTVSPVETPGGRIGGAGADVGCETRLKDARNAMLAAVDRANLTVHAIDPQGLVNVGPHTRASSANGFDRPGRPSAAQQRLWQQQTETTDRLTSQQALSMLPGRTGGRALVGRNNPEEAVPEIFRESAAYYLLGVERARSDRSDTRRSIEVKVARKGVRVYAQRHYLMPPPPRGASGAAVLTAGMDSSKQVLTRLLPNAGLPLALAVTAFASPDGGRAIVRTNVDAGAFARDDGTAVPLEITIMAVDQTGRAVASARQTSTVAVTGSSARTAGAAPRAREINVQSHLELAPGEYEIRVAVSDPVTRRIASVFSDITIPPFNSAALSLSGVNVDIASTRSAVPAATTRRVFQRNENVRALLQVYQGTASTGAIEPVSIRVQILDAKGTAVREQSLPFTEQTFTNRRADCVITIPVASLPPGEYLLKLEASLDRQSSGRALRFAVQ